MTNANRYWMHVMRKIKLALCLLVVACGCSSTSTELGPSEVGADELLTGAALGISQDPPDLISEQQVLALSRPMRDFLAEYVDPEDSDYLKLQQLVYAIINEGSFGLEYDDRTRTAAETFASRRGNCLSFSNMFVAMAREVGLAASYQEVDVPPDWTFDHDTYVLNRHVNVLLDVGVTGEHVVDFNIDDFRASYDRRAISDPRALAHYFNNLGVEYMQADDTVHAFAYFRKALTDNDRDFAPAWTNLGTLYRRSDFYAYAEAAYLQALKADHLEAVAMSNLAALYQRRGDRAQAEKYRKKVASHRRQNPYFRYQRAREAFYARRYDAAEKDLKYAIRKRPNEDQFYFLLGLVYLQKGNTRAARQWLERAEDVAATDALKRNYSRKMDVLMSANAER